MQKDRWGGPCPRVFVVLAVAGTALSCASLQRDKFPGSFRAGVLNDRRDDLFERPRAVDTPTAQSRRLASAAPARVPPLAPSSLTTASVTTGPQPQVPPWSPAASGGDPRRSRLLRGSPASRSTALALAVTTKPVDGPRVPALSGRDAEPRRRVAPTVLATWLRHGENPAMRKARIVQFAGSLVGARRVVAGGRRYASNCSDFVRAVFSIEGVDLYHWPTRARGFAGVRGMYGLSHVTSGLHFKKTPEPGDLVFFHHTYDFNRNQRIDDFLSHVGVVEKMDGDGTVHYIDYSGGRVRRGRLNLRMPYRWRDPQSLKQMNSYLRRRKKSDPPGTSYLAGDLFAGFGTLIR